MPERETLQKIIADPHSSEQERSEAQRLLDAEPSVQPEPELHLTGIATIAAPERELLRFAGADKLAQMTPLGVIEFMATRAETYPETLKTLLAVWSIFRGSGSRGGVTGEVWRDIKARFPESERRIEFNRIIAAHPFLGNPSTCWRDQARHLEGMCSQNDDYTVRKYFLPRVAELLSELPEYEFGARDRVQALLDRYNPKEPNGKPN